MNTYPVGSTVTVSIPFEDQNGNPFVPTGGTYRVLDELEAVQIDVTPLNLIGGSSDTTIIVPAGANMLPPPETDYQNSDQAGVPVVAINGLREIEVTFITATGPIVLKVVYVLGAATKLFLMQNSFQPYNQAILTALSMPNLNGWTLDSSTDDMRIPALIEAYGRLTRLGYYVRWPLDPDAQSYINWGTTQNEIVIPRLWSVMTTQRWFQFYPEVFRAAMRKAQVAEADQILAGDIVLTKRRQGIISEKTGESSMMFRGRKPLDLGISNEALGYITGFVDFRMQIWRS